MNKIRTALIATMTLMILVFGSGLAQALPIVKKLKPNW